MFYDKVYYIFVRTLIKKLSQKKERKKNSLNHDGKNNKTTTSTPKASSSSEGGFKNLKDIKTPEDLKVEMVPTKTST